MKKLNVFSEIGKLKSVFVHCPGDEINNLTPDTMERLLFDDIPFLKIAKREHEEFVSILKSKDIDVMYLDELILEQLKDVDTKKKFVNQFIDESGRIAIAKKQYIYDYLIGMPTDEMIKKIISGIRFKEIKRSNMTSLRFMIESDYGFICEPMPNLYFTRDPFAVIGTGVSINYMKTNVRNRETIFGEYIFADNNNQWYNRNLNYPIEGGDILVLSDEIIAIGVSERTKAGAVDILARNIIQDTNTSFKKILAFEIPAKRAFMHLDTVFTQVDYSKFTVHPEIIRPMSIYEITEEKNELKYRHRHENLEIILSEVVGTDVQFIECGGGDFIDATREQWNDGSNTLAIAPGEVIVYDRNVKTNEALRNAGIIVNEMSSSELSRGRGGPRCMSMPFYRE